MNRSNISARQIAWLRDHAKTDGDFRFASQALEYYYGVCDLYDKYIKEAARSSQAKIAAKTIIQGARTQPKHGRR